ncbi:MAG: glycosyl hydrolase family 28-related protein, partial [Victivallaceae bacterium]
MINRAILIIVSVMVSALSSWGDIVSLSTVNDLRSTAGGSGWAAIVRGHTYVNKGGGIFVWDSSSTVTDNDGTVIQVTGVPTGRWVRQINDKKVNVEWFGAYPNGTVDCTTAFRNAITATGNQGHLYIPTGRYKVTGTLEIPYSGFNVTGDGMDASNVIFQPTANGTLFLIRNAGQLVTNNRFAQLRLSSSDTTYRKVGIEAEDVSGFTVQNVYIGNDWIGNDSVGIYTKGRESVHIGGCLIRANVPLKIGNNPNSTIYECDHFSVKDTTLRTLPTGATSPTKNVYVEDNVVIYNMNFGGQNAWIGGDYGFYWNITSDPGSVSYNLEFNDVRTEQGTNPAGYAWYINNQYSSVQGINLINCYVANARRGVYLRNADRLNMIGCYILCPSAAANVIDLDGVDSFNWMGCDIRSNTTVNLNNMAPVWTGRWVQGTPLPKNGLFEE